jgi:hypothetical protein
MLLENHDALWMHPSISHDLREVEEQNRSAT